MSDPALYALLDSLVSAHTRITSIDDVTAHLRQHPHLIEAVQAAVEATPTVIGTPYELELLLKSDPEIADYRVLTLVIRLASYDGNLLEMLDHIQDAADRHVVGESDRLLVTSDFGIIG